jgi:uncharacterized protein YndB with AHSA1/START domain
METVKIKNEPVIVEKTFDATPAAVWDAITNRDKMAEWYFDLKDFKAEVGFEFQFLAGDEKSKYLHICKVTEVIPGKKLSYSWKYQHDPGVSEVSFEIFSEGRHTKLRLTHTGLENFSKEHPELDKKNFAQGWDEIINTNLKKYLES